jgi:outer membrane protein
MKRISLFLCSLILSMSQFAIAADETKVSAPETKVSAPDAKATTPDAKATTPDAKATTPDAKASAADTISSAVAVKIGSVDLPRVAEKSEAGVKAMASLKEMYDKFQAKMKTKEKELEKLKFALQGKNLTAEKRETKEKQFQKKFGEYQQFGKDAQQEFGRKQAELSKQIKDDLDRQIKDYGRDHGYALILNKEGLVYNDSKYEVKDLTDEITKIFSGAVKK